MRTTLTLDDDILELAARQAKARGVSLGKTVSDLVRRGLNAPTPSQAKGGLVVFQLPADSPRVTTNEVQLRRREWAVKFAAQTGAVVVLKGKATLVTDGERVCVNDTGNPGMATAGSGDVLTGLLAALLAQGFGPFEAAQLAVNRHGRAGDLARDTIGEVSLIATDILDFLPKAIREVHADASG